MAGSNPPRIRRLDEAVVNRIAAGEVIVRPASALKELLENALDAGSTQITITVRDGGFKLLQVQDNGKGISKEDMDIVCERFTTSKLRKYEDLRSIGTFGFRGEALASISHIARLSITTKVADSPCAYRGNYVDGKLAASHPGETPTVRACAGNNGTLIVVEDMFYNMATRRKSLRSTSEELRRITDVVGRYSILYSGKSFTCKKAGASSSLVHTTLQGSRTDAIRTVFGAEIARELIPIEAEDESLRVKMEGLVTSANYAQRRPRSMVIFINNRLVNAPSIKKAIESTFLPYLPKGTKPFAFLHLEMAPEHVDVNVHPTKNEVHFLHEDRVCELVVQTLEARLAGANESRTFMTQLVLPGTQPPIEEEKKTLPRRPSASAIVRIDDARTQTLESVIARHIPSKEMEPSKPRRRVLEEEEEEEEEELMPPPHQNRRKTKQEEEEEEEYTPTARPKRSLPPPSTKEKRQRRQVRPILLSSIKILREGVVERSHQGLTKIVRKHHFVGCVDGILSLIQHDTRLYLVNACRLSQEMFYQLVLRRFGNFGYIRLSEPVNIEKLCRVALEQPDAGWQPSDRPKDEICTFVRDLLISKAVMLDDYFSIGIDEKGMLTSLPIVLESYLFTMEHLPRAILHLGTQADWKQEQECFHSIAKVLAYLYSLPVSLSYDQLDRENDKDHAILETIEHIVFPAMRQFLLPTSSMSTDGTVIQVASCEALFRVFERC